MFVFVTLICIWLSYHLYWIRQRHSAIVWLGNQAAYWDDLPLEQGAFPGGHSPWRLRMLGEAGMDRIIAVVEKDAVTNKKRELLKLFPEAKVGVYTPGPGYRGKRSK